MNFDAHALTDAVTLWRQLQKRYGLDPDGYDQDLVTAVRERLGLPDGDLARGLSDFSVSVEDLLHAVLVALGPFAGMLTDLLRLYERAGASRADDANLRVEYDFGSGRPPLSFNLEKFREWVHVTRKVSVRSLVRRWNVDQLEALAGLLSEVVEQMEGRTVLPRVLHARPKTGHPGLDQQLLICRAVHDAVVTQHRRTAENHEESTLSMRRDDGFDADSWMRAFVADLAEVIYRSASLPRPDQDALAKRLAMVTNQMPVVPVNLEMQASVLAEILSLPAWQRRHELYSAWALTQIVDAAEPNTVLIHTTPDGKLSFSFSGSHVATIKSPEHGTVFVVAELRSALKSPVGKGRRHGIQPDYTLLTAPFTARSSGLLVVECKQYRKESPANFSAALSDYAGGYPYARVLLMNYGAAADRILDRVPGRDRSRCFILPRLRPGEPLQQQCFRRLVREALALDPPTADKTEPKTAPSHGTDAAWATIQLEWGLSPRDLDLYVTVRRPGERHRWEVGWNNPGSATELPFAVLHDDVMTGKGPDMVTVLMAAELEIEVERYSKDGQLAQSDARVRIITPRTDLTIAYPAAVDDESRQRWRVATVAIDGTVQCPPSSA